MHETRAPAGVNREFLTARRTMGLTSKKAWILGGTASVSSGVQTEIGTLLGN